MPTPSALTFIVTLPSAARVSTWMLLPASVYFTALASVGAGADVLSFGRFQNAEGFAAALA